MRRAFGQAFIGTFEQTWLTVNPGGNCYYLFHLHCDSVRGRFAAAVGPTMIPLLRRVGVSRPGTAAAILGGTFGSMLSPGLSHNAYVAKMANLDVIQTIGVHMNYTLVCGAIR